MSLERVLKILTDFGLSQESARVYIYMAKTRPQNTEDLATGLNMNKRQINNILDALAEKGVVTSRPEFSGVFSALAFEELINLYIKVNMERAQIIEESKDEILQAWRNMTEKSNS